MISSCSRRPCGKKYLASKAEPAPLSPGLDPRGCRAQALWRGWQRSHLLEIREEIMVLVQWADCIPPGLKAAYPPRQAWGHTAAPSNLRGPSSRTSEMQSWAAKRKPGQQGSSWSWQTENTASGKNKARGSLEKLHSKEPLPPSTNFVIQYKILN